ncbi:MAG: right-handed parallel beta-helix repeat-containing protein [Fuerstiella sp.]|nr:right-handed parallel beta-helix repeat-containing protein [Fuerstiella sp.]MCP4857935.1 right-handed parallel beta-helix repeat-containing protein [Fuerstiella sp.]
MRCLTILALSLSWISSHDSPVSARTPGVQSGTTQEETAIVDASRAQLPKRKPPKRNFPVLHTLSVTDFEAMPDDGKDDLIGIRMAMKKAAALGKPTALRFPLGTYDLFLPENPDEDLIYRATKDALAFFQASDIIFDGQGSTIMIHEPTLGFLTLLSCNDVVVRNFTVEWNTPPFAQGWVREIDHEAGWFELEETPGFLSLDATTWNEKNRKHYEPIRWGMLKDRTSPGRMKAGVRNFFQVSHWDRIAPHRYRLFPRDQNHLNDFEAGDPYIHVDRNGGGLCHFTLCKRVVFENITNYTSPGLNYGGAHASEIGLFNCNVLIKPGSWHTSNADGTHFSQNRIGPWVEGCTFEGMSDDGANLYAHPTHVIQVRSDKEFDIEPTIDWRPGDLVMGFEPTSGEVLGKARVVTASVNEKTRTNHLTLDMPILGMKVSEQKDRNATYFLNLDLSSGNFVFRDNTFRNVRRFGILMQTHDGLVENNTFEGVSSSSIIVRNSSGWPEGFATGNIVIRGNTIRDGNFDGGIAGVNTGDISVYVRRVDGQNGVSRDISQVEIVDNLIINTRRRAIHVASATDIRIVDNVIRCLDPATPVFQTKEVTPINLRDVDRVTVRDNVISEPRKMTLSGVAIQGESTAVDVSNNRLEFSGSN